MATTTSCHYDALFFTLKSHEQQAPTVVEGKPGEGEGFVGPVAQGLGVST